MHFYYEFMNKIRFLCKNPDVFESWVMKRAACAALALVPEDVPIDLGVIATRIKVAPYCRIINAALQPPAGRV